MLAIRKTTASDSTSINILPCRINQSGPTKVTKRYWQPRAEANKTKTAHFRGRRLRGRVVKLPEQYRGIVLKPSDQTIIEPILPADDDEEPELPEPVKVVEEVSNFDEMTIWGHDQLPASDDNFINGVEEWISFAEAIHSR